MTRKSKIRDHNRYQEIANVVVRYYFRVGRPQVSSRFWRSQQARVPDRDARRLVVCLEQASGRWNIRFRNEYGFLPQEGGVINLG